MAVTEGMVNALIAIATGQTEEKFGRIMDDRFKFQNEQHELVKAAATQVYTDAKGKFDEQESRIDDLIVVNNATFRTHEAEIMRQKEAIELTYAEASSKASEHATYLKEAGRRIEEMEVMVTTSKAEAETIKDKATQLRNGIDKFADKQEQEINQLKQKSEHEVKAMKDELKLWADGFQQAVLQTFRGSGGSAAGSGGGSRSHDDKEPRVDRKEVTVWKLPEGVSRD